MKRWIPKKTKSTHYEDLKTILDFHFTSPQPRTVTTPPIPNATDVVGIRIEYDGILTPYAGFRCQGGYNIYPLNTMSLFESSAWHIQMLVMASADRGTAQKWFEQVDSHPNGWRYTAALKLAGAACHGNLESTCKAFEFAQMTPEYSKLDVARLNMEERMQLHPGWRLYVLTQHMFHFTKNPENVEECAEAVCRKMGWIKPAQALQDTINAFNNFTGIKPGTDALGSVVSDFTSFALKVLKLRISSPLLGVILGQIVLPPLHRKIKPNGEMEIRIEGQQIGSSWLIFYLLGNLMDAVVNSKKFRCPLGCRRNGTEFPGDSRCTCELKKDVCFVTDLIKRFNLKIMSVDS